MFEFVDSFGGVLAEIFDRILVAEPVRALDGVVHVPAPIVLAIVAKRGRNAALRRHRVAACREDFGYAGGLEAGSSTFERSAQTRAARADDNDIECVIDNGIRVHLERSGNAK